MVWMRKVGNKLQRTLNLRGREGRQAGFLWPARGRRWLGWRGLLAVGAAGSDLLVRFGGASGVFGKSFTDESSNLPAIGIRFLLQKC